MVEVVTTILRSLPLLLALLALPPYWRIGWTNICRRRLWPSNLAKSGSIST